MADNLANQRVAPMATLAVPMATSDEVFNPNAVKVVCDSAGYALYFSRAPIPYNRDQFKSLNDQQPEQVDGYMRHIGIYAYRADFIKRYVAWNESPLERIESLEQLRVLWHGRKFMLLRPLCPQPQGLIRQRT